MTAAERRVRMHQIADEAIEAGAAQLKLAMAESTSADIAPAQIQARAQVVRSAAFLADAAKQLADDWTRDRNEELSDALKKVQTAANTALRAPRAQAGPTAAAQAELITALEEITTTTGELV